MKEKPPVKERTLYWMIMGRPVGTPTWMQVPYVPRKNRCGNHFATQVKAEKAAMHLADRATPTWLPKTRTWAALEYTVVRVVIPTEPHTYKGKA